MSTDHEDLDPMTEQEIAGLAALDRRGRAAGVALMTAASPITTSPTALDTGDRPDGAAPSDLDLLRRPDRRAARPGDGRPVRRTWLLVAAVLALVVAVAGAALVLGPRDPAPTTSSGRPSYLLPRWLPEGYEPTVAATDETIGQITGTPPADGQVVVYGQASAPDPWTGATLSVVRVDAPWHQSEGEPATGQPVTIAGHPGVVETEGDVEKVTWGVGDVTYSVLGEGVSQTLVLEAAENAGPQPSLDQTKLPTGFAVIARAPMTAVLGFDSQSTMVKPSSLMLGYGPRDATDQNAAVFVFEQPGAAGDVDLARLWVDESRVTQVRGQHAVVGTHTTPGQSQERFVQWWEPSSGMLMTVVGRRVSEDDLLHVVAGMAPEEDGEVGHLLHDYGADRQVVAGSGVDSSVSGGDGSVAGISTELASGDQIGTPWTFSAVSTDTGSAGLELHIGGQVKHLVWDAAEGPGRFTPAAPVAYGQPERAVVAASDEPLSEAYVMRGSTIFWRLDSYPVTIDGHDFTAFLGFVPVEDNGSFTVVIYNASGRELERHQMSTGAG